MYMYIYIYIKFENFKNEKLIIPDLKINILFYEILLNSL